MFQRGYTVMADVDREAHILWMESNGYKLAHSFALGNHPNFEETLFVWEKGEIPNDPKPKTSSESVAPLDAGKEAGTGSEGSSNESVARLPDRIPDSSENAQASKDQNSAQPSKEVVASEFFR